MGPTDGVFGDALSAADLAYDASLQAARSEFAETWDILEAPGGSLVAVPPGTVLVWSATVGGLAGKLRRLRAAEFEDEK